MEALRLMVRDHGRRAPAETGGVVMGYRVSVGEIVITAATSAGPRARHRVDGYDPDVEHDQAEIARLYAASGRLHTYLGDWHTHPDSSVGLSRRDRRTLRAIARDPGARAPSPLMLIVASTPSDLVAAVWCRPAGALRWQIFRIKPFD